MSYDPSMHASRGSPRNHHGRREHGARGEYEERQGNRRSLEGRRHRGSEGYGASHNLYTGSNGNRKAPRVSIEDAIGGLFDTLTAALDFYVNFKREFDGETRGIRAYAGSVLLEELWASKAISIEGRAGGNQRSNTAGDIHFDQDRPLPETTFKAMYRELSESFSMALTAAPNPHSRSSKSNHGYSTDPASLDRLMKKLRDAYKDIKELSAYASNGSGDTQALITETELVLAYLDKSRDLWDPRYGHEPNDGRDFQDHDGHCDDGGDPDGY